MQHLFISHSHQDEDWVDQLDNSLQRYMQQRGQVWMDKRNIPPTIQWQLEVRDAIEGAAAVVACESASFHASENCRYEIGYARKFGTRIVPVQVGEDPAAAADRIMDALLTYGEYGQFTTADVDRADRIELRRLARTWHQLGRPRRALVGRWRRRRLKRSLRQPPPAEQFEHDFLRASLSRARRRTVVAVAAVSIALSGGGGFLAYAAGNVALANANAQQAAAYADQRLYLQAVEADPYRGLAVAATLGGNESHIYASVITAALRYVVPDDAFTVDRGRTGLRFAQRPVTTDVIIIDANGDGWQRSATATDIRTAARTSVAPDTRSAGSPWPAELSVEVVAAGVVNVHHSGELWRTIHFDAPVVAPQISPDGRFLAAAGGSGVQVADLSTGRVRFTLRGAPGALTDLAWSADSARVWGTVVNGAVAWTLADAKTLRNDPSAAYSTILPSTDPHRWWLVDRQGLVLIDEADGRTISTRTVPEQLVLGAGAADGSVAAVVGQRLWIVDLVGSKPARPVHLENCLPGRPTFQGAALLYLPCLNGDLLTIDLGQAAVVRRLNVTFGLASAVVLPGTDAVVAGNRFGELFLVQGTTVDRFVTEPYGCEVPATRIAVSGDASSMISVGAGTAVATCGRIGWLSGVDPQRTSDWTWHPLGEPSQRSILATAVAFNRSGDAFATAYADGTIILHPTRALSPAIPVGSAVGVVRDMVTTTDGNLLVVTASGMVQRLPFDDGYINNASLAKVANERLEQALSLGLAERRPT